MIFDGAPHSAYLQCLSDFRNLLWVPSPQTLEAALQAAAAAAVVQAEARVHLFHCLSNSHYYPHRNSSLQNSERRSDLRSRVNSNIRTNGQQYSRTELKSKRIPEHTSQQAVTQTPRTDSAIASATKGERDRRHAGS